MSEWPGWKNPCNEYLPWGDTPPDPYPRDACGACGWSRTSHTGGVIETAEKLAEARKAFAEAFLLYRTQVPTDKQAEAMAQIDHGERVLLAEAAYELAKRT